MSAALLTRRAAKPAGDEQRDIAAALADDLDGNFVRLVTAYQDRVFGLALNLVADRHVAEELAQDAFVAAYRALRGYSPDRRRALSIRAWLTTIVLNRVRNRARLRPHASLDEEGAVPVPAASARDAPPAAAERAEARQALREALARLPLRYRAAVVLRHVDGHPYADIATLLGAPVGTVKANVHRGLALLRDDDSLRMLDEA